MKSVHEREGKKNKIIILLHPYHIKPWNHETNERTPQFTFTKTLQRQRERALLHTLHMWNRF